MARNIGGVVTHAVITRAAAGIRTASPRNKWRNAIPLGYVTAVTAHIGDCQQLGFGIYNQGVGLELQRYAWG